MSSDATFAGTNYQASVIAYVFVHVLTETKLRWLFLPDDTPSAVSGGRTGGRRFTSKINYVLRSSDLSDEVESTTKLVAQCLCDSCVLMTADDPQQHSTERPGISVRTWIGI